MFQRERISPESSAERGTLGQGAATSPAEDCGQKDELSGWEKFMHSFMINDPRSMSIPRATDSELSIWTVPRPDMEIALNRLQQQHAEASARVLEHPEPHGEEWGRLMDEMILRLRTYLETFLLFSEVMARPKPTRRAMVSATRELRRFDKSYQYPFGGHPDYHRYLEEQDEVHQLLRALLKNKYIGYLFPCMPEIEVGVWDISWMNTTATILQNIGMVVISLGPFGWALFKGVSDTESKIVLFVAAVVGVTAILMKGDPKGHVLVLGLMAVMAGTVFGGRDNA